MDFSRQLDRVLFEDLAGWPGKEDAKIMELALTKNGRRIEMYLAKFGQEFSKFLEQGSGKFSDPVITNLVNMMARVGNYVDIGSYIKRMSSKYSQSSPTNNIIKDIASSLPQKAGNSELDFNTFDVLMKRLGQPTLDELSKQARAQQPETKFPGFPDPSMIGHIKRRPEGS